MCDSVMLVEVQVSSIVHTLQVYAVNLDHLSLNNDTQIQVCSTVYNATHTDYISSRNWACVYIFK